MKKYIYIYYIVIGLLFVEFVASAQPEAVFNKVSKHYVLRGDGSSEMRYRKELTLKTHIAMNSLYGETFIVYNPDFQSVKINESYTKQADGTIIKTPDNAFNEVLPSMAADAPAYNSLRELVVTHTGLEIGATIILDYTLSTKSDFPKSGEFYVFDRYQERSPITLCEISVSVPQGKTVYCGTDAKPAVTGGNGETTYLWTMRNVPAASLEPFVPQSAMPFFCVSTTENNESQVLNIMSALSPNKSDCETVANKLAEGKSGELEKAKAIQKFVVSDIANCNVPLSAAGKVRTPAEVLKTAYGTFAEKTVLFVSMLQAVDLNTEIACAFPENVKYVGAKSMSDIKVKVAGEYLSPVSLSPTNISMYGDRKQIWISDGKTAKQLQPEETAQKFSYSVGLTLDSVINIKGEMTDNFNEKTEINETKPLNADAGYMVLRLPTPSKGFDSWGVKTLNTRRTQPLELLCLLDEACDYSVEIPSGKNPVSVPYDETVSNKVGTVSCKMTNQDGKINIRREIKLNKTVVPVSEYADFRKLANLWNEEKYRTVILK